LKPLIYLPDRYKFGFSYTELERLENGLRKLLI